MSLKGLCTKFVSRSNISTFRIQDRLPNGRACLLQCQRGQDDATSTLMKTGRCCTRWRHAPFWLNKSEREWNIMPHHAQPNALLQ